MKKWGKMTVTASKVSAHIDIVIGICTSLCQEQERIQGMYVDVIKYHKLSDKFLFNKIS